MRRTNRSHRRPASQRLVFPARTKHTSRLRPAAGFRQRFHDTSYSEGYGAPETWHEPVGRDTVEFVVEPAGKGYVHPVTTDDVRERIEQLPKRFRTKLEIVQFSRMTRKRALFPCYGMQWGTAVYLYPIEASLVEHYARAPRPEQFIEARMFGGQWQPDGRGWNLIWTAESIRDFYLNNVLIHEIGHTIDDRNGGFVDRERFANWFAVEYGYRASRGRR
ncbi:MAG TPA: hypothetical protein VFG04_13710 [Planctomycetaceae bacterium]|jgi:hypothetical protein|nr:hypothetical protein [Planctomycetaceae bacterium]